MKSKYPIKRLSILNIVVVLACAFYNIIIVYFNTENIDISNMIYRLILGCFVFLLILFSNMFIVIYYEKQVHKSNKVKTKQKAILSFIVSFLVFFLVFSIRMWFKQRFSWPNIIFLASVLILLYLLSLFILRYILVQEEKINTDKENSQLKIANTEAANQLLRQQIHPHMLFNSLNTIKSLYNRNPAEADEYLVYLSEFLRASISNNNIKIVSLKDELKLCEAYLIMQKIRFREALTWSVSISEKDLNETRFIPSFSIQPLVENAIKHNELTEKYPLHITIKQVNDCIKVSNNIRLKESSEISSGFGLANLTERYRLISNDEVVIEDNGKVFSVSIKLLNHENSNNRR